MNFGKRIKELREINDIKQKELADFLNVTTATLSRYENNKSRPNDEILIKIANFFNVTIDYLIGESNSNQKELTKEEKEIIETYRSLPKELRRRIKRYIEFEYQEFKKQEMLYHSGGKNEQNI